jgi:hypothetical protein
MIINFLSFEMKSVSEVIAIIQNISRHIDYMHSNIKYIHLESKFESKGQLFKVSILC